MDNNFHSHLHKALGSHGGGFQMDAMFFYSTSTSTLLEHKYIHEVTLYILKLKLKIKNVAK